MTLNEIIETFRTNTEELNLLFSSFSVGQPKEFGQNEDIDYPHVFVETTILCNHEFSGPLTKWSFVINFADKSSSLKSQSRLLEFAKKWFSNLRNKLEIEQSWSTLLYEEKIQDRVCVVRSEFSVVTRDSECLPELNVDTTC